MHIQSLTLSHFRSHKRAALTLDQRPIALVGLNGAGKTNLLEAVSLFSPGRGMRRAAASDISRRPESLGWKVTGEVNSNNTINEIEFASDQGSARSVRINSKPEPQTKLGQLVRLVWLVPAMDRLWIEAPEGRRRFLDRLALSFFPDHGEASLIYEKAMRQRNRLLKDQVRDPHWYKALEARMAEAGAAIQTHRLDTLSRLAQAQASAQTAFPAAELELVQAEGAVLTARDDLAAVFEESRFRDIAAGRTLMGPHRADLRGVYASKGTPASECSTGEQKALLISLVLSNARALVAEIGAPPIVLLDEVAAHLDPTRRAALYDEICALGTQAWMTGTERNLFEDFDNRAQLFEVSEEIGETSVIPVG